MRSLVIAAVVALALGTAAHAAASTAQGPYHVDANGRCHAANGVIVPHSLCAGPPLYPYCKQGVSKQCGKTCIPITAICHKHQQ